jgi:hypothetical protein
LVSPMMFGGKLPKCGEEVAECPELGWPNRRAL